MVTSPVKKHSTRKAKDTDYLLITEDMKTYGCGCCSIGLGGFFTSFASSQFSPTGDWVVLPTGSYPLGRFRSRFSIFADGEVVGSNWVTCGLLDGPSLSAARF